MKEVLQQLANLQYIDSRIDELKQLRGDLPEDILDVETDIARLEAKQAKLEQEDKDLSVELNQLELDITSSTEKVSKYEEQQLTVRNNREYDALTKARKFHLWKSGQLKKIKRAYNKRFRKYSKGIRNEIL